jgi:hypothetical protein
VHQPAPLHPPRPQLLLVLLRRLLLLLLVLLLHLYLLLLVLLAVVEVLLVMVRHLQLVGHLHLLLLLRLHRCLVLPLLHPVTQSGETHQQRWRQQQELREAALTQAHLLPPLLRLLLLLWLPHHQTLTRT